MADRDAHAGATGAGGTSDDGLATPKQAARESANAARAAVGHEERAEAVSAIARQLLALPELASARTVLAYVALPHEIDPALAVLRLRQGGALIAYPRIEAPGVLGLHEVDDVDELVAGPLGIAQPSELAPRVAANAVDAVIVPGVAFDAHGFRLGYGGGYYDRLLPMLRPDCARVGIAFEAQLLPSIPAEEHDIAVDFVVTPSRVIRPEPRRLT